MLCLFERVYTYAKPNERFVMSNRKGVTGGRETMWSSSDYVECALMWKSAF